MAKSDYGRDMYRQLTEVMARLERVEEKSRKSDKKHETGMRKCDRQLQLSVYKAREQGTGTVAAARF